MTRRVWSNLLFWLGLLALSVGVLLSIVLVFMSFPAWAITVSMGSSIATFALCIWLSSLTRPADEGQGIVFCQYCSWDADIEDEAEGRLLWEQHVKGAHRYTRRSDDL